MTRIPLKTGRLGALAGALALCAGLTSCDTVPAKAATVNGSDIRRADFERDIKALAANPSLLNLTGGTERSIQGDAARNWLAQLITWQAAEDLLAARGLSASADATKEIQGQLATGPAADLPQSMKDEIVQGAASIQSLDQVPAPSKADLGALYADVPASTGALCARHILVKTEDEANAVLDELAAGADFSELAKQRSIDAATKDSGGALVASDGNACRPLGDYQTSLDPSFTASALAAEPGVPSGPVQTTDGWHVILIRPFDEVADDLVKLVGTAPGDAALTGVLGTAQVTVDPRYGRWDQVKANVVSLH